MAQEESKQPSAEETVVAAENVYDDCDGPDEWDKRIFSTGCADENDQMRDCYTEKRDWRLCTAEMEQFKECWKSKGNDKRTESKDA